MNILVVEDQYKEIEGLLDYMNFKSFDNKLTFTNIRTSQDLNKLNINEYSIIIVDIQLDYSSEKDGLMLVKELLRDDDKRNIIIITGKRNGIAEDLKHLKIIYKPLDDDILSDTIKSFKQ
jgi:DNA-binding response OmpR family regulator